MPSFKSAIPLVALIMRKNMPSFKSAIPLVALIMMSIGTGWFYWHHQQQQLKLFSQQVESIKVNRSNPVEPKDYFAIRRDLIVLQNTLNSSAFQLVGSLLFFITAYIAWLNLVASEKKQVSERFAKAVDQLGNNELCVRVGGIFVLEQIAQSSPEDHWAVIEVLTSYIRDQSLQKKSVFEPKIEEDKNQLQDFNYQAILNKRRTENVTSVTTDTQAALTVIGRRNSRYDPKDKVINLRFCDMRGADLKNAKLNNADLTGANISRANMESAKLLGTILQSANLTSSVLNNAKLRKAKLNHAQLNYADLEETDLQDADLTNAQLKQANLQRAKLNRSVLRLVCFVSADLQGTDLSQAKLNRTNLNNIVIDNDTKLDEKWRRIHDINTNGAKKRNFDKIDFSGAVLTNANFEGASLKNANFNGTDLGGAIFKNAYLEGASFLKAGVWTNLDMADFGGANLKEAVFKEASLKCTNFKGLQQITNLSETTFEGVDLASSIFQEAIIVKAKFIRSILQNVNFHLANLSEAEFDNCYSYSEKTNFEQANLNKAVFTGPLGRVDFRNSNYQQANFTNADISLAQF
jgi:uncharacterized protein YjbI with pentapeptide repeats